MSTSTNSGRSGTSRFGIFLVGLSIASTLAVKGASEDSWVVDSWNAEKGLPNNTITAIAQTRDGFLWVGTDNGLARFDGHQFKVFTPQNTPCFSSARVRSLCADDSGALWILTMEPRLVCLRSGKFSIVDSAGEKQSRTITSLTSSGGVLWYVDEQGIVGTFEEGRRVPLATHSGHANIKVVAGPDGSAFVANNRGVEKLGAGRAESLFESSDQTLRFAVPGRHGWWLGTETALMQWQDSNHIHRVPLGTNIVQVGVDAREDRQGNLWLATEHEGVWCRTASGTVLNFTSTNGLGGDSVLCLFEDQQGTIWTGGERSGLSRLRRRLFQPLSRSTGLSGEAVTTVCEGRAGELWVGTEQRGVARMVDGGVQFIGTNGTRTAKRIRSLLFSSTQRLWVGTQELGLFYFEGGDWEPFRAVPEARQVSALFEDDHWGLWLGSGPSKAIIRLVGDAPQQFPTSLASPTLDVRVFTDDGAGGLWIGTQGNGVLHWNGRDYQHFTRKEGLSSDTIWALWFDASDGALWIGTAGGGLNRLKSGKLQSCTKLDGLYDNVVCQILDDRAGGLWCSSPKGVYRVLKAGLREFFEGRSKSVHCAAYGLSDGLPSLECAGGSQPSGCRGSDGLMWWPTAKGLAWVEPSKVPIDTAPPSVVVDEMLVDDKAVEFEMDLTGSEDARKSSPGVTVIEPGTHRIEFRYTALSWVSPEFVKFRHRLSGFEEDWVETGLNRVVHYVGLPPNDYGFQVRAANRDGVWSPIGATVLLRIKPVFWQTWWFSIGTGVALAAAVGVLVSWFLRRGDRTRMGQLERMHAVEQERARIAQDIHDDLGASLTEIALLSELAQSQIGEQSPAREHLDSIFNNARNLARATDEIVWALHPKNNSVEMSLNFMTRTVQEFLRAAGLRCRLDIPPDLPEAPMSSATRHHLYLAVKEALNNVVKHSGATEVWLRFACEQDYIILTVEDNGRGFDPDEVHSTAKARSASGRGHGLRGMEQRMLAVGGRFQQTSTVGGGTLTRFIVPLQM